MTGEWRCTCKLSDPVHYPEQQSIGHEAHCLTIRQEAGVYVQPDGRVTWAFKIGGPQGHYFVTYAKDEDEARAQAYRRFPHARGQRLKVWRACFVEPPW